MLVAPSDAKRAQDRTYVLDVKQATGEHSVRRTVKVHV